MSSSPAPQISPQAATVVPLPAATVLTKLRLTLTASSPTPAESRAFAAAVAAAPDASAPAGHSASFLRLYAQEIDRLMATPAFVAAASAYHAVWWHLPEGDSTALAGMIVGENRPYREVLSRDYIYTNGANASAYQAAGIATATPLPSGDDPYQLVRLAPSEQRFRSLWSQPDFLLQVPDTPTNHNRKRSNYVFRTMLCEDLVNVVIPGVAIPVPGPHGTNPDCQGCHTRLDPLARFFDHWSPADAGVHAPYDPLPPATGALVLKGPDGRAQLFAGQGETQLGLILAELPQAKRCVVRKIWEFAMGTGTPLDPAVEATLLATYERTGQFKPTLRQALLHPYFWSTAVPPPLNYARIRPLLQVCAACHGKTQEPLFAVDTYPLRPNKADNAALLHRIWGVISSNPDFPRMPPAPQPTLATESVAQIKDWLSGGALDDNFQPSLSAAETDEVLSD